MLLLFFSDAGSLNDEQAVLSPSCTLAADATVLHSGGFMDGIDEYTHLMLHFDGANGSQTIVDSSQYNHSFTASSGAVLSNTQRKFGLTSGYLPTSADYFRGDSSADLALGSGDFVVDFWVYIANDSSLAYIDWGFIYDNTKYPFLYANGTRVDWYWGGTSVIEGPTVTIGQWQHIAVVKSNNVTRIFLNGVQGGSDYADTNDYQIYTGEASPSIGALLSNEGVGQNGYYDEVRFSIGTDRGWANGFTPPKIPYTKLAAKWSPANLTSVTLEGWYRLVDPDGMAADGSDLSLSGSDVNSWADQSGNERTLNFQGTSNIVYSATSVGGGPGVTADGNSSLQTAAGMGYPANSVIGAFVLGVMSDSNAANSFNRLASFIVANGADVYNASGVVPLMANPSSGAADISYFYGFVDTIFSSTPTDTPVLFEGFPVSTTEATVAINTTTSGGQVALDELTLDRFALFGPAQGGPPGYFIGSAAEVVLVAGVLSTSELQKLEGYLAWNNGQQYLLPDSHPYISQPPTLQTSLDIAAGLTVSSVFGANDGSATLWYSTLLAAPTAALSADATVTRAATALLAPASAFSVSKLSLLLRGTALISPSALLRSDALWPAASIYGQWNTTLAAGNGTFSNDDHTVGAGNFRVWANRTHLNTGKWYIEGKIGSTALANNDNIVFGSVDADPENILFDDFSRYADNTVMSGQTPELGPSWSTTGDVLPTISGGELITNGLGYLYTKLSSTPQALGTKISFTQSTGSDTTQLNVAMSFSSQSGSNLTIEQLVHYNFGPEGLILGVFDASGNFTALLHGSWTTPMATDGTVYETYFGVIGSTCVVVGPNGEVFAVTDPNIASNWGPMVFWEPITESDGLKAEISQAYAANGMVELPGPNAFNPADLSGMALSNGNCTATGTSSGGEVRCSAPRTSGKVYNEYIVNVASNPTSQVIAFGIASLAEHSISDPNGLGGDFKSIAFLPDGSNAAVSYGNSNIATYGNIRCLPGDVIAQAADYDLGKIWWRNVTQGTGWLNGTTATQDPASGLGGVAMPGGAPFSNALCLWVVGDQVTINNGQSPWVGTVPAGFGPLLEWDQPAPLGDWVALWSFGQFEANASVFGPQMQSPQGNDRIGLAIDLDNELIWYVNFDSGANPGHWNDDGTGSPAPSDPGSGVGGASWSGLASIAADEQVRFGFYTDSGSALTLNAGDSGFVGSLPSGFMPWIAQDPEHGVVWSDAGFFAASSAMVPHLSLRMMAAWNAQVASALASRAAVLHKALLSTSQSAVLAPARSAILVGDRATMSAASAQSSALALLLRTASGFTSSALLAADFLQSAGWTVTLEPNLAFMASTGVLAVAGQAAFLPSPMLLAGVSAQNVAARTGLPVVPLMASAALLTLADHASMAALVNSGAVAHISSPVRSALPGLVSLQAAPRITQGAAAGFQPVPLLGIMEHALLPAAAGYAGLSWMAGDIFVRPQLDIGVSAEARLLLPGSIQWMALAETAVPEVMLASQACLYLNQPGVLWQSAASLHANMNKAYSLASQLFGDAEFGSVVADLMQSAAGTMTGQANFSTSVFHATLMEILMRPGITLKSKGAIDLNSSSEMAPAAFMDIRLGQRRIIEYSGVIVGQAPYSGRIIAQGNLLIEDD